MRCSWLLASFAFALAPVPFPQAWADPVAADDVPLSAEELEEIVGAELGTTTTDNDDPTSEDPAPTAPPQCRTLTGSDSSPLTRGLARTGFRAVSRRTETGVAEDHAQASQLVVSYASADEAAKAFAALEAAVRACGDQQFEVLGGWDVVFQPSIDQIDGTDLRLHLDQRNGEAGAWRCATSYHQQESFVLGSSVCWSPSPEKTAAAQDEAARRIVETMLGKLA